MLTVVVAAILDGLALQVMGELLQGLGDSQQEGDIQKGRKG